MQTAYGDGAARPTPDELIDYLEWCRRMHALLSASTPTAPHMSLSCDRGRASVAAVLPEPPAADLPDGAKRRDGHRRFWHR